MHFLLQNDTSQWIVDGHKHLLILFLKGAQILKFCIFWKAYGIFIFQF